MSCTLLTKLWLLLCCVAASRQLSITKFVVPQSVQSGEDVELKCNYDLVDEQEEDLCIKWWMIPLHGDNRTQLYQRLNDSPGVAIRHNVLLNKNEQDSIILLNVTPVDSGIYECEVSNVGESRKHQDLIVFTQGTGPQLNLTTVPDGPDEGGEDDLLIECTATGVAPTPDFILTVNGEEVNITEVILGPDEKGLYDIVGNTTISKEDAADADIRCELIYVNPNITHQQYLDTEVFTDAGFTTAAPEDTTELDTTPDSFQDERGFGCQPQASVLLVFVVSAIARFTSLL